MNQDNPQDVLLSVIDKVLEFVSEGKQAKAQHILPFVYESVMQYPNILWNTTQVWKIAKIFMVMHHYDMVEEEDDEIKMLQMALVYTQRAIELCEKDTKTNRNEYFNALHTQVMLYSSCSDYFETTIAELYSKIVMTDEEKAISMRLAGKVLPMLYYNVLVKIDDNFADFNGDSFLSEMCNNFELTHSEVTPKQLEDAEKIHKMLIRKYLEILK